MSDASASLGDSTCQMSEPDSNQPPDISWSSSPASTPSGRGSTKRTQTATETWAHAKKLKLDEQVRRDRAGNRIWVCGKCPWESASLTSARNHLALRHGVKITAQQRQVVRKGQAKLEQIFQRQGQRSQAEANERERSMLSRVINQSAFDESLLQLIVNNNLPHKAVEYPELYSLIMSVNYMAAHIYPKSRAAIPRKIEHAFLQEKDELKQHLQAALSEIHLACDVWTTDHKKMSFLAIVAHFVDAGGKSRKALLGLPRLLGSHGGQHQAEHVNTVIDWYGIAHTLGYYIGDNHGSNDKCCRFISRHLGEQYQIDWQPKTRRIRCHGHVINLASQAFIFAPDKETIDVVVDEVRRGSNAERGGEETDVVSDRHEDGESEDEEYRLVAVSRKRKRCSWKDIGPLRKLHVIVAHMRASELLYNEFLDAAGRMIPMDNDTRWNSWYTMGAVACELEGHVDAFVKAHRKEIGKYALSPEDWDYPLLDQPSLGSSEILQERFEAQLLTREALNDNQASLVKIITHLRERLETVLTDGDSDERLRLKEDIQTSRQCLEVCKRASNEVASQKIHIIGEVVVDGDSDHVVVTTLADLLNVGKTTSKNRSALLVGSMSDDALVQLSHDRYNSRFGAMASNSQTSHSRPVSVNSGNPGNAGMSSVGSSAGHHARRESQPSQQAPMICQESTPAVAVNTGNQGNGGMTSVRSSAGHHARRSQPLQETPPSSNETRRRKVDGEMTHDAK